MKKKTILMGASMALLFASPAMGATLFQIDFQRNGATNQETQAGWTAWNVAEDTNSNTMNSNMTTSMGIINVKLDAIGTGAEFRARGGTNNERNNEITGTSWNDVQEDFMTARTTAGTASVTITLTGLSTGYTYTLTGFHNDNYAINAGFSGAAITTSLTQGTLVGLADNGLATNLRDAQTDTAFNNTGISFQVDGSGTAVIRLDGGSTMFLPVNGLQLTAVPEPTTALLGSLGVLALLRRRRA